MKKLFFNGIKILKSEYKFILTIIFIVVIFNVQLPYVVYTPGGATNMSGKVHVKDSYKSKGTLNGAYVKSVIPNLPFVLLSYIIPDWDLEKKEDQVLINETFEEMEIRSKVYMQEANSSAIIAALKELNLPYEITEVNNRIIYVYDTKKTDLKLDDEIITVDGFVISNIKDLQAYVETKNIGDKINFYIKRLDQKFSINAEVFELEGRKLVGIMLATTYKVKSDYNIIIDISSRESGPSGGLISALAVYDALTKEDITKGKKIIATGTIDINGGVGVVGGIKYKLIGAVKEDADIFIVPKDNLEEALELKRERKYAIKIFGVETFSEALAVLKEN